MGQSTPQGPNLEGKAGLLEMNKSKNAPTYNEMYSIRSNSNDKVSNT